MINGRLIGWVENVGVSRLRLESAELDDHQSGTSGGFWRDRLLLKPLKPCDAETIEIPWTDANTDRWMTITVTFQAVDSNYRAETTITLEPVAPQYSYPQWQGSVTDTRELFEAEPKRRQSTEDFWNQYAG